MFFFLIEQDANINLKNGAIAVMRTSGLLVINVIKSNINNVINTDILFCRDKSELGIKSTAS